MNTLEETSKTRAAVVAREAAIHQLTELGLEIVAKMEATHALDGLHEGYRAGIQIAHFRDLVAVNSRLRRLGAEPVDSGTNDGSGEQIDPALRA